MAGGGGGRRAARAESRHRLGLRRRPGRSLGRQCASPARTAADSRRPHRVRGAGGRCGHAGHGDEPRHAPAAGRRAAGADGVGGAGGAGQGRASAGPQAQTGPPAGRQGRVGAVVLHDVHRAWRRPDAGPSPDSALPKRRPGAPDHSHRIAGAGSGRRLRAHRRDARRGRLDGVTGVVGLPKDSATITGRITPILWYRAYPVTFMVAQT